ncbi:MAG: AmmeMemoRadiSam system radical SAM enzyme [Thermoplasmatales archaeon]|nr:AmmeMemoRadiSam system radical SAM enzyme [Thermoplasmatales archaeon]
MAAINPIVVEARYYERRGDKYQCDLCPHRCLVAVGKAGRCGARRGLEEFLEAGTYGRVSSLCLDPIEKKPFYHFRPKEKAFSVGSVGCNLTCRHCQNYPISQSSAGRKRTTYVSPPGLASMCRNEKTDIIAFTYNEPTIWPEYIFDVMRADPDLTCVLVTNGFCNEGPLKDLCDVTDAMNIDIKGFTEDFYGRICGGDMWKVLSSAEIVHEEGVHLELTYLLIPGHNDSLGELRRFADWVMDSLSPGVPIHFTRFHPDNEMGDVPWTSPESLENARGIALEAGLENVYIGNIISEGGADTYCPNCGNAVIRRTGYLVDLSGLDGDRCASCRSALNIIR